MCDVCRGNKFVCPQFYCVALHKTKNTAECTLICVYCADMLASFLGLPLPLLALKEAGKKEPDLPLPLLALKEAGKKEPGLLSHLF